MHMAGACNSGHGPINILKMELLFPVHAVYSKSVLGNVNNAGMFIIVFLF